LIGSSGCGKTTLLSSIIGMTQLDQGEIYVLGEKVTSQKAPNCLIQIGYMPQDTSLHEEFTIDETLSFYGNLYQMDSQKLQERSKMIKSLLELPDDNQKIGKCSGGEKRRVSLAVALIHDPKLLILDEPCVGLDPMLRESIWKFLLNLTRSSEVTVIVTTHYIEEARQAHRCGFMRNGVLIAEESPEKIMENLCCDNLDEAFLKLCCIQESIFDASDIRESIDDRNVCEIVKNDNNRRKFFHFKTLKALAYKSFIQTFRRPA
jgi:ABC-type multidrug transport system ATPase subunit